MEEDRKTNDSVESVSIEGTRKILNQLMNCICKIKIKGEFRTGFFCKIPFRKETIKILMTNYQTLNEKYLEENKEINLLLNDEKEKIIIDLEIEREIYFNEDYDITLIELKETDEKEDYIELDDNLFQDNPENIYKDKSIYVLQYPKEKNACVSYGLLNNIDKNHIIYKCRIDNSSSCSPILNLQNNKVKGIYKNNSINHNI